MTRATTTKPKSKSKAKPKSKSKAKAKPKARAKAKAKATPASRTKRDTKPKSKAKPAAPKRRVRAAVAQKPATRQRSSTGSVVGILDAPDPIEALQKFLQKIRGKLTPPQGQIALGAAQLLLLPIAREHRGGAEACAIVDLILAHWDRLPERTGFHARELLREAFIAIGSDRERLLRLVPLVPLDASPELRFVLACALAAAGERDAMLHAVEGALAAGVSARQFQRERDFSEYLHDPALQHLLAGAGATVIPVDVRPHTDRVRKALDSLLRTLRAYGEKPALRAPATLDAVLEAERAAQLHLPNDYRALLTISDGLAIWNHEFLGTADYRDATALATTARAYLDRGAPRGIDECVPIASCGTPDEWLLYDPHGAIRGGQPGYVLVERDARTALADLTHAIVRLDHVVRDALATN